MSKKILLSILTIVVAIGLVGVGTYALWSDTATSANNTFATGSLKVAVTGGPVTIGNMYPGATATYNFSATNTGTIPGSMLLMTGSWVDDASGTLSSQLMVVGVSVNGTNIPIAPTPITALGTLPLGPLASGATDNVAITIMMNPGATGNMNESVTGNVTFTLNQ